MSFFRSFQECDAEILRLRAENERLREELEQERVADIEVQETTLKMIEDHETTESQLDAALAEVERLKVELDDSVVELQGVIKDQKAVIMDLQKHVITKDAALDRLEWVHLQNGRYCEACKRYEVHAPDCWHYAARKAGHE